MTGKVAGVFKYIYTEFLVLCEIFNFLNFSRHFYRLVSSCNPMVKNDGKSRWSFSYGKNVRKSQWSFLHDKNVRNSPGTFSPFHFAGVSSCNPMEKNDGNSPGTFSLQVVGGVSSCNSMVKNDGKSRWSFFPMIKC